MHSFSKQDVRRHVEKNISALESAIHTSVEPAERWITDNGPNHAAGQDRFVSDFTSRFFQACYRAELTRIRLGPVLNFLLTGEFKSGTFSRAGIQTAIHKSEAPIFHRVCLHFFYAYAQVSNFKDWEDLSEPDLGKQPLEKILQRANILNDELKAHRDLLNFLDTDWQESAVFLRKVEGDALVLFYERLARGVLISIRGWVDPVFDQETRRSEYNEQCKRIEQERKKATQDEAFRKVREYEAAVRCARIDDYLAGRVPRPPESVFRIVDRLTPFFPGEDRFPLSDIADYLRQMRRFDEEARIHDALETIHPTIRYTFATVSSALEWHTQKTKGLGITPDRDTQRAVFWALGRLKSDSSPDARLTSYLQSEDPVDLVRMTNFLSSYINTIYARRGAPDPVTGTPILPESRGHSEMIRCLGEAVTRLGEVQCYFGLNNHPHLEAFALSLEQQIVKALSERIQQVRKEMETSGFRSTPNVA